MASSLGLKLEEDLASATLNSPDYRNALPFEIDAEVGLGAGQHPTEAGSVRGGLMTRRMFSAVVTAGCRLRTPLVLEAVAAERMPHQMVVRGVSRSPFFELRDYGVARAGMAEVLERHGIRAAWKRDGRFLFPFETLAAREAAWRRVSADAEWSALRAEVREISVYRVKG